jgi:hypothetical protein
MKLLLMIKALQGDDQGTSRRRQTLGWGFVKLRADDVPPLEYEHVEALLGQVGRRHQPDMPPYTYTM